MLHPSAPAVLRGMDTIPLCPWSKFASPPWVGGTFTVSVFSKLYPCKSLHLSPVHSVKFGWRWTLSVMCTLTWHSAAPVAHRGEKAGFLPHRDQTQVQRSTAEPQRAPTITANTWILSVEDTEPHRALWYVPKCHYDWWMSSACDGLSLEWTCTCVTAWLMWLHTLSLSSHISEERLPSPQTTPPPLSLPALCAHTLWCIQHCQRMLQAGFAIMVSLITAQAWFLEDDVHPHLSQGPGEVLKKTHQWQVREAVQTCCGVVKSKSLTP